MLVSAVVLARPSVPRQTSSAPQDLRPVPVGASANSDRAGHAGRRESRHYGGADCGIAELDPLRI